MSKIFHIKAIINEIDEPRDISKFSSSKFTAMRISEDLKKAAYLLGLGDVFEISMEEEEVQE